MARGEGRAADPQKPDLHHTGHRTGGHSSALPGAVPSRPAAVTVLWDLGVTRTLRSLLLPSTWGGAGRASFPFSRPPESRTVSNGPPWRLPVDGWPNGKGLRATWPPRESGPSAPRMHGTAPGLQVGKPRVGRPGKDPSLEGRITRACKIPHADSRSSGKERDSGSFASAKHGFHTLPFYAHTERHSDLNDPPQ